MSAIIQECWQNESSLRPHASQVSQLLADKLSSSDVHENFNSSPITAVSESSMVSMPNDKGEKQAIPDPTNNVGACPTTQPESRQTFDATAHLQTLQNYKNELQSAFECASNDNTKTYLDVYDLDDHGGELCT